MAEEESMLTQPHAQDVTSHVHDFERFTKMMKWGAVVCLLIGLLVLIILK